ncbi:sporulation related domain protein [bacterium BMS3Abin07]|nr:sporulation related domain protein [bacterium BMS3Abin07]GBE31504.1 sporulation related domain protein [bacterium BMS3Bbin05]HDL19907.1 SPOR domain-containing protein [Nitrospirota bacterium]HDO22579.1 SPOR domain-containing protein [Nitrospirota bacterium]HDZ87083.1 SPOR domain-containing protein [Nitrospirota bacterium]
MKHGSYSNIPEIFFRGKSILIITVVVISAFSFMLGYLVGKKSDNFNEMKLIETKKEVVEPPPPITPDKFDRTPDNSLKQNLDIPESSTGPSRTRDKEYSAPAKRNSPEKITVKHVYAIQVGAFKKRSDAGKLRKRLADKGYNSYVVSVKLKRGHIYKVRAGRYSEMAEARKDASAIKKMKGLDAFVLVEK